LFPIFFVGFVVVRLLMHFYFQVFLLEVKYVGESVMDY
jgi:hypothetical protein